ncbi:hypothetical protein BATDEDRAFT_26851 [Batrachochytrium dendrobatidis JAM81]|uniref:CMP/dCMP-type deaminase domain-containing protein n=1 Tax=Batrachochytrium dendrobatidis (strain JAM81 / FGSC 10211) TaxID=684364 RepID=F4P960_BATDJ|nr:uncharacterized protein BATDEDRAFT_26851 [Batrachochytrium dendrobatidis JAM81]EGF78286.1 hypothetical protein BATDEDRAFT_26851 [Batrachochytrium dendrobatidis JAM81]KAJ8331230.1 hypothetical protein O5D80_000790 [Batrachochytrium dendrobatidis]|eukprot:XP_006681068.1 hypothetical protein BATDEDRAFT_26851 [Batrachochytrium dendrobatidis JAM81]
MQSVQGSVQDQAYMKLAIAEANKSIPSESAYCVGAVLVLHPSTVYTGYSRELPGNTHAEQVCLIKASHAGLDLDRMRDAIMYTTMEPCSLRLSGNLPCVNRLIDAGISKVLIGILEPPNLVENCSGVQMLTDAGIQVVHLTGFQGRSFKLFYKCGV